MPYVTSGGGPSSEPSRILWVNLVMSMFPGKLAFFLRRVYKDKKEVCVVLFFLGYFFSYT